MTNTTSSRRRTYAFVMFAAYLAAFIYAVQSSMTGQGLAGYLMGKQMEWTGSASLKITVWLTAIPFMGVVAVVNLLTFNTFWRAKQTGQPTQVTEVDAPLEIPGPSLTWSFIGKTTVVLFSLTGLAAGISYVQGAHKHSLGTYELNLDSSPTGLPESVDFIRITGTLAHDFAGVYRETSTTHSSDKSHLFVPVTPTNWNPAQPVRFFLHYSEYGRNQKLNLPEAFRRPGATAFGGTLGSSLPVFVRSDYEKHGIKLADGYKVLDYTASDQSEPPIDNSYLIFLILGGGGSLAVVMILTGWKLRGVTFPSTWRMW